MDEANQQNQQWNMVPGWMVLKENAYVDYTNFKLMHDNLRRNPSIQQFREQRDNSFNSLRGNILSFIDRIDHLLEEGDKTTLREFSTFLTNFKTNDPGAELAELERHFKAYKEILEEYRLDPIVPRIAELMP